jgi:hypothetical protein
MELSDPTVNEYKIEGNVVIRRALQRDGTSLWKIVKDGFVLGRDGNWHYEPQPSSRTDQHIEKTRWETPYVALCAYTEIEDAGRAG